MSLGVGFVGGLPLSMSAQFSGFYTPSPPPLSAFPVLFVRKIGRFLSPLDYLLKVTLQRPIMGALRKQLTEPLLPIILSVCTLTG